MGRGEGGGANYVYHYTNDDVIRLSTDVFSWLRPCALSLYLSYCMLYEFSYACIHWHCI